MARSREHLLNGAAAVYRPSSAGSPPLLVALTGLSSEGHPSGSLSIQREEGQSPQSWLPPWPWPGPSVQYHGQVVSPLWALFSVFVNWELGWQVRRSLRTLSRTLWKGKILTVQRLLRCKKRGHTWDPHPGAGRAEAEAISPRPWGSGSVRQDQAVWH